MANEIGFNAKDIGVKDIGNGLVMLHFEDAAQPSFVEKKGKPYILYGEKNDYPDYLLYLYNNSAKHSAIINGKVDYVCGKGWQYEKENTPTDQIMKADAFIKRANAKGESLLDVTEKAELDIEIFNGAYLQVVWNLQEEIASIYHLDYTTVRSNKDNSVFFVCDDWVKYAPNGTYKTNNNPEYKEFPAFNPNNKKGSQILYIKKYHPGIDIYTLPNYRGSITWIEVDIEIGNYHLNNVKGGFFSNKIINFNNGKPSIEEQAKIERMFAEKFGGVRGRKYMLAFNADTTKATTAVDLSVAESDKLFDQLNKTGQQEIFTGHRITSPMLFGIKTEGQLGGRTEMREAYEAFQNIYVNGRQQWIEKAFNMLAGYKGVTIPLTIQRSEPIGFEFDQATIAANLDRDEIREFIADKLSIKLKQPAATPAAPPNPTPPAQQFSAADDERDIKVFAAFGVAKTERLIVKSRKVMFSSNDDEHLHFADAQSSLTDIQQSILDILINDPLTTQQTIAEALDIDLDTVNGIINDLADNNLIKVTEKTVRGEKVIERKPVNDAKALVKESGPITKSIQIMYSYEGPQDSKNRPFCAKLMELNRLYSRSDIEQISAQLKYSVWTRRGGWYTIPGTNEHRPYCRHSWVSNVVVKNENQ